MMNLLICGDYYPVKEIEQYHKDHSDPSRLFGDLLPEIKQSDFAIYNQEYPLTNADTPIKKYGPNLKGDPICIEAVKKAGFNVATLANNHTLDFEQKGMLDTVKVCESNGLKTVGWGKDFESSRAPLILEKQGVRIAIINCAENEFNTSNSTRGGAYPLNPVDNVRLIRSLKDEVNHIVVIIHGGTDFCHYPSLRMRDQYRFYAESGASAVIGHHTHMVSGYEEHNGVPIFYSIGNLLYPYTWNPDCQETIIVKLKLTESELKYNALPYRFESEVMQLKEMKGETRSEFQNRLDTYSKVLNDDRQLEQKWAEHIEALYSRTVYFTLLTRTPYILHKVARKLKLLSVLEKFIKPMDKRMLAIWNLIRCETHNDATKYLLSNLFHDVKKDSE